MAVTVTVPNEMKYNVLYALLNGKTVRAALMQGGFTFDPDTHGQYADVSASEVANGNGYTTGGIALTGLAISQDNVNNRARATWSNGIITASGGALEAAGAIIYIDDTDDYILEYIDFGGNQTILDGQSATIANPEFNAL